jgi:hypothetical protein
MCSIYRCLLPWVSVSLESNHNNSRYTPKSPLRDIDSWKVELRPAGLPHVFKCIDYSQLLLAIREGSLVCENTSSLSF